MIVINRGANTLKLYDAARLVRAFHVATGQSAYPTPTGLWQIVDKQREPLVDAAASRGPRREADPAGPGQSPRHALDGA